MDKSQKDDGVLQVATKLPRDLATKFLKDCEDTDRDMSSMARHIIRKHYKQVELDAEVEKIKLLQKSQSTEIPHFGADELDLQQDVSA